MKVLLYISLGDIHGALTIYTMFPNSIEKF